MLITLLLAVLTFPQASDSFFCKLTGFEEGKTVLLCDTRDRSPECANSTDPSCVNLVLDIPDGSWPEQWPQPTIGASYQAEWKDGRVLPVLTDPGEVGRIAAEVYARSRAEQLRWMRHPVNPSGRP